RGRFRLQQGRHLSLNGHRARLGQTDLTALEPDPKAIYRVIDQVALAVAHITAALFNALGPVLKVEFSLQMDVTASQADPFAIDARKIGLAADSAAVTAIQRVIPDVQLPHRRRVHG